jgi:tetratricopeptide (TPR) repeat protein
MRFFSLCRHGLPLAALGVLLLAGRPAPPAGAQQRPSRPALIRDTATAEGKDEADPKAEKAYNPMLAEKSLKIGHHYLKRKNYPAAIQRYLEALEYQPSRVETYDSLGRVYEKSGDRPKALETYRDFISKYPNSPKTPEFRSRIARLEKK